MKFKVYITIIFTIILVSSCSKKTYFARKATYNRVYVPTVRSPEPIRLEKPTVKIKYTHIKIKVLQKYEKETYNKMYNNPFNRNDGLTFTNWDEMYDKISKEFEISPEDSEKLKEFKRMNAKLQQKLKESGLSEKQIRRFYVLNYLQAQTSE